MASEIVSEFAVIVSDAENAAKTSIKEAIRSFAKYMAKEWTMTQEQWRKEFSEPPPTGTYWDGYNAGIASAKDCAEFFIDEFPP